MNLRKVLLIIGLVILFITGCSTDDIVNETSAGNEAIYQKTMTKVQNDVNVIMNKDYTYVLENMGIPYCTTYYIDFDHINDKNILNLENEVNKIRLVYPKYTNDNKLEESALYIEFKDDKVVDVQNNELSDYNIKSEKVECNNEIVINQYNENINLPLNKIENINFDSYIGKEDDELYNDIGEVNSNFEIYCSKKNINVIIYILNEINSEDGKILVISEKDNKIENIGIMDSTTSINLVREYLKNN
ncbi:MAG: hypothetical protein ACRC92_15455 [Peptostreptococcaceae bacterium]